MDKQTIIDALVTHSLTDVILMHGASMVMHGVKSTTADIDVMFDGADVPIDCAVTNEMFDFGDGSYRRIPYVIIDGIKCQTLESIKEEKVLLGREKDLAAIAMIEAFCA